MKGRGSSQRGASSCGTCSATHRSHGVVRSASCPSHIVGYRVGANGTVIASIRAPSHPGTKLSTWTFDPVQCVGIKLQSRVARSVSTPIQHSGRRRSPAMECGVVRVLKPLGHAERNKGIFECQGKPVWARTTQHCLGAQFGTRSPTFHGPGAPLLNVEAGPLSASRQYRVRNQFGIRSDLISVQLRHFPFVACAAETWLASLIGAS